LKNAEIRPQSLFIQFYLFSHFTLQKFIKNIEKSHKTKKIACAEVSFFRLLKLKVLNQVLPAQELSHITVLEGGWQIVPRVNNPEGKGAFS